MKQKTTRIAEYQPPTDNPTKSHAYEQLVKLHDVVGGMIAYQMTAPENMRLPTKKDRADWVLGPEAGVLREDHDADYGLFIYFRDAYSSPGRIGVIVVGAILGVPVAQGRQVGYGSLVDLRTGDIVWFNMLADTSGDLRTPEAATKAVTMLLEGFPL